MLSFSRFAKLLVKRHEPCVAMHTMRHFEIGFPHNSAVSMAFQMDETAVRCFCPAIFLDEILWKSTLKASSFTILIHHSMWPLIWINWVGGGAKKFRMWIHTVKAGLEAKLNSTASKTQQTAPSCCQQNGFHFMISSQMEIRLILDSLSSQSWRIRRTYGPVYRQTDEPADRFAHPFSLS